VQYSPIGSGGGIQDISNRSVDFGASDAPMSPCGPLREDLIAG
jgi:phosphate transport system substrate-binding protein